MNIIDLKAKNFLKNTDWLIIRQNEQNTLGNNDFEQLKVYRQRAREQIGNEENIFNIVEATEFLKQL